MKISVDLAERSYDIEIDHGARHRLGELVSLRVPLARHAVVVVSESVRQQPWFDVTLDLPFSIVTIPEGDEAKDLSVIEELCHQFSTNDLSRRDIVIGYGGGATTEKAK